MSLVNAPGFNVLDAFRSLNKGNPIGIVEIDIQLESYSVPRDIGLRVMQRFDKDLDGALIYTEFIDLVLPNDNAALSGSVRKKITRPNSPTENSNFELPSIAFSPLTPVNY